MKIELIQATPNPILFISTIAGICYDKEDTPTPQKRFVHLYENSHHSTFEHVYYTFKIEGISRACLAQLTRHRHASYTVRSQRYCNENNRENIVPPDIDSSDFNEEYHLFIQDIFEFYEKMKVNGIKKEDARLILPQATSTDLYMSLNLRELIHINELRTHKSAQWEIRDLVNEMVNKVLEHSPELKVIFKEEE